MKTIKSALVAGAIFLFLAVGLGAFGAHGLENKVSEKALGAWKTGVTYQFYHAFALLVLASLNARFESLKLNWSYKLFIIGIIFFSFNCYLYTLTSIKTFGMLVPIGGLSFLAGWAFCIKTFIRDLK